MGKLINRIPGLFVRCERGMVLPDPLHTKRTERLKQHTKKKTTGSHLLISSLPGSALTTHVESLSKPRAVNKCSQSLAW